MQWCPGIRNREKYVGQGWPMLKRPNHRAAALRTHSARLPRPWYVTGHRNDTRRRKWAEKVGTDCPGNIRKDCTYDWKSRCGKTREPGSLGLEPRQSCFLQLAQHLQHIGFTAGHIRHFRKRNTICLDNPKATSVYREYLVHEVM